MNIVLSVVMLVAGLFLLYKYYVKRKAEKEQKGFVVIAGTLWLLYMFPGAALIILGLLLLFILL